MGYSTIMFGVDLERIKATIANQDLSIVDSAREQDRDEFDSTMDEDDPTVGQALETIIMGRELNPMHLHQYGYAFKLMCETLGELLPDDDMIGDLGPLELDSPLENFRSPIDIPAQKDFPYISFLTSAEVNQESQRLLDMDLSFPANEDIEEGREAFANCIRIAAEKNLAIVTFYH